MKKILTLFLTLVCVIAFSGCSELSPEHQFSAELSSDGEYHWHACLDDNCTEVYKKEKHSYGLGKFSGVDDEISYERQCLVCAYKDNPTVEILYSDMDADDVFRNYQGGGVFWLKQDQYSQIDLEVGDLVLGCEDGTIINGIKVTADTSKIDQGISNLEFHNLTFNASRDGFVGDYNILNLSFISCKFSGSAQICSSLYNGVQNCHIGNLVLKDCEFKDIHTANNLRSAVVVTACTDLTIEGCTFDGADFNALQIGEKFLKGKIKITDNVFKNIGNRYVKLLETEQVTSCDISGNTFYKTNLGDNPNDKRYGNYFQTIGGNIAIGINTWEEIPENDPIYFLSGNDASPIVYDPTVQKLLGA